MDKPRRFANLGFYLKRILLVEGIILAIVAVLCLVFGVRGGDDIGLVTFAVGGIVFAIGPFSLVGSWGTTRSWNYQYAQTMNPEDMHTRMRRDKAEVGRSAGLLFPSLLFGSVTMALAAVVQWLFG
jgi:hypothetical protein